MTVSREELMDVVRASAEKRYWLFVDQVCASKTVYTLGDDDSFVPVWPSREYGELYLRENPSPRFLAEMSLNDFRSGILTSLQERGVGVSVFPVGASRGLATSAGRLAWDLDQGVGPAAPPSEYGSGEK